MEIAEIVVVGVTASVLAVRGGASGRFRARFFTLATAFGGALVAEGVGLAGRRAGSFAASNTGAGFPGGAFSD